MTTHDTTPLHTYSPGDRVRVNIPEAFQGQIPIEHGAEGTVVQIADLSMEIYNGFVQVAFDGDGPDALVDPHLLEPVEATSDDHWVAVDALVDATVLDDVVEMLLHLRGIVADDSLSTDSQNEYIRLVGQMEGLNAALETVGLFRG